MYSEEKLGSIFVGPRGGRTFQRFQHWRRVATTVIDWAEMLAHIEQVSVQFVEPGNEGTVDETLLYMTFDERGRIRKIIVYIPRKPKSTLIHHANAITQCPLIS